MRNRNWPVEYFGVYWHADFVRGTLSYLTFEKDSETVKSNTLFSSGNSNIISIAKDFKNNLWITRRTSGKMGIVEKITYANTFGNKLPTVSKINVTALHGGSFALPPIAVQFTSDASDADIIVVDGHAPPPAPVQTSQAATAAPKRF